MKHPSRDRLGRFAKKQPYRDRLGRFARRPKMKGTRRTRRVHTQYSLEDFIFYREIPTSFEPPKRPRKSQPIRLETPQKTSQDFTPYKPATHRKWEDLEEILDTYIDDLDLDEDIIGGS